MSGPAVDEPPLNDSPGTWRPASPLAGLIHRLETVPVPRVFGLRRDTSLLFWAWFIWGMGAGLWNYLWPVYLSRLGADSVQIGLVVGTSSLVTTLVYLPGGIVAQAGRHKWQIVAAHTLAAAGTASFGLAGTWWQVLPGVFFTGLVALFSPAVNSYITQAADEEGIPVPTIFTAIAAAQFATMTISPPIGGWIADQLGIAALFPLVAVIYAFAVTTMCLLRSRPLPNSTVEGPGVAGTAGRALAARRSALAAGGDAYRTVLGSGPVRLLLATAFLLHVGVNLGISFGPLYLRQSYGYDATAIGWTGSAASGGTTLLLLLIERLRRRRGPALATQVACGLIGAHYGCIILSPLVAVQAVGFFCRGGVQVMGTQTMVVLTELVGRPVLAPAVAVLATVAGLAAIIAPPVGGWLYEFQPASPFLAGIAVLLVSLPMVTLAYRTKR